MSNPFWACLGIEPTDDRAAIDSAYEARRRAKGDSDELRFAWKALRDPYYRSTGNYFPSAEQLIEAGFFDDGLGTTLDKECYGDPRWLGTPFHKILRRLHHLDDFDPAQLAAYPPAVLLTTGSFSPIHNGHIDMMELAKSELIQRGYTVLGGYLSPSHDSYVSLKQGGAARLLDEHRIRLCHESVAMSEWIMVDPWEARYVPSALNFTDVIDHLGSYLNHHLKLAVPLKVWYVFGGDNAKFARAFVERGQAVCVERPGYEREVAQVRAELGGLLGDRLAFARPRLEYLDISSSSIRAAQVDAMPERTSAYYDQLRANTEHAGQTVRRRYIVRDESAWATAAWYGGRERSVVDAARQALLEALKNSLVDAFGSAEPPDQRVQADVKLPALEAQQEYAERLRRETNTINLDVCTTGTYQLQVSRLFGLADGQCFSTQIVSRPGFEPIAQQIERIPAGSYELLDDDIASGRTIKMVTSVFPDNIQLTRVRSLLEQTRQVDAVSVDEVDYADFYDVVDFRDFLIGSRCGGLVVRLPDGETARVPYLAPYVTLSTRARLPASQEVAFSARMWEANAAFFRALEPAVLVSDADPVSQKLLRYLGFGASDTMLEVVEWHINRLADLTRRG